MKNKFKIGFFGDEVWAHKWKSIRPIKGDFKNLNI